MENMNEKETIIPTVEADIVGVNPTSAKLKEILDANIVGVNPTDTKLKEILDANIVEDKKEVVDCSTMIEKELNEVSTDTKISSLNLSETAESVAKMNFIEASRMKKNINKEIENLKMAKTILDSISGMSNIDTMNKKIMSENVLSNANYDSDATKFNEEYNQNMVDFSALIDQLDNRLAEYESIPKTSKFLNGQMVDCLTKRIEEAKAKGSNAKSSLMINFTNTKNVYEHRDDLSFITAKSQIEHTIKRLASTLKNKPNEINKAKNYFLKIFNPKQMTVFRTKMDELFNGDKNAVDLFIYHLYKMTNSEKESGNYNWGKALIMNIIDIEGGIYDLETPFEDYYTKVKALHNAYAEKLFYSKK